MLELEGRHHAASIVQALHERGVTVQEITVAPFESSLDVRAYLDGPCVLARIPLGYFSYDQVADALIAESKRCSMETS